MTDQDIFQESEPEVKRDRWGRYVLNNPFTGNERSHTRVTTFARTILDSYALNQWEKRMVVKGMSLRTDLVDAASALEVAGPKKDSDKYKLDKIAERAKDAAGGNTAAHRGTSIHSFAEKIDQGLLSVQEVPERQRPDLIAYQGCMEAHGLTVVPELLERIVCLPQYEVAGRLDKVLLESDGTPVIADVKSGQDLSHKSKKLEISVQLACYAHGINTSGVWNIRDECWEPAPKVREDYALVIHIPAGSGSCEILTIDLQTGWEAVKLCADVRDRRNDPPTLAPYAGPRAVLSAVPAPVGLEGWQTRFRGVRSKQEAGSLYREARRTFPEGSSELASLVTIGREALGLT